MEYKVEDLVLYNEKENARKSILQERLNYPYIFGWEHSMSEKEKIDFIDTYYKKNNQTGWATYMLDLINKYLSEKGNLPKDSWGSVKTNSLKAWLRRNDPRKVIDDHYHYGSYYFLGRDYSDFGTLTARPSWGSEGKTPYYNEEGKILHLWFHDFLKECYEAEKKYHIDHDPTVLKIRKISELGKKYGEFGIRKFGITVGNGISVLDKDWVRTFNEVQITEDDIDKMLEVYEDIDSLMTAKTKEIQDRLGWEIFED